MYRSKDGEIVCPLNFYIFEQNPMVFTIPIKPPRKNICPAVLISSDFTKINLTFLVIFSSLVFVRNDKGKASFCFAISQSIVRSFSFSFKLSLICRFFPIPLLCEGDPER